MPMNTTKEGELELDAAELYWNVEFQRLRTLSACQWFFCPSEAPSPFSQGSRLACLPEILQASPIMVVIVRSGLTQLLLLTGM